MRPLVINLDQVPKYGLGVYVRLSSTSLVDNLVAGRCTLNMKGCLYLADFFQ